MNLLEVRGLRKCYNDVPAVDGLSFELQAGEVLGLLGPNGAGKTTTMSMIAGLLEPDEGEVLIDEQPAGRGEPARKLALGIVPQDLAVYPDLTARENLLFFGRLYGVSGEVLKERAAEILARIGLTPQAHAAVRTFSGGMKRRLNFGVALMHAPRILILDEPTVGVDPQSRSHLLECVREQARGQVGVIYASHYMEEVEAICKRVVIVDHGRVIAAGTVDDLLNRVSTGIRLHVAATADAPAELRRLADVTRDDTDGMILELAAGGDPLRRKLREVLDLLDRHDIAVRRIETEEANLERLFLELTGHSLRD